MINRKVLEDLLRDPLGPYRDRDILHETACQTKGNVELVLYSFVLERSGRVTGLDESELRKEEGDKRKFRFRGVLKIADPRWLSDFGVKTVEGELNLRANERALREGERRLPPLTLEGLFESRLLVRSDKSTWVEEDGAKLTVLIQGERNLPAIFMQSARVPNGLLWRSEAHNREYQVETMVVETYSLSENFFWRWRLFALMTKIRRRYPYIPPHKRTPRWFAEKYIAEYACPPEDKTQRLIFDEEDSDVDEKGRTKTLRHLLKPHMSEILGLFAAHAQFFITNNEVGRGKLFDIRSWVNFEREARRQRKEAARCGVRWGWSKGEEARVESSEEEARGNEDELHEMARKNPVIGKDERAVTRKLELARAKSGRGIGLRFSSDPESGEDAPGGAAYVSDFAESSDAEENGSDYRSSEEEAIDQIPWQLRQAPDFPDVDGRWWCPLEECNHPIDLHALTDNDTRGVPAETVEYIAQKEWRNAYDKEILDGFRLIVTNHYMKHFQERGVGVERKNGEVRFVFVNSRKRRRDDNEPIRGPMPARGTLRGESRVEPIFHPQQAQHFR